MKLLLVAIISWLLGLAELLLPFYNSSGELNWTMRAAPGIGQLISAALLFALLNAPALYWIKRHREDERKRLGRGTPAFALLLNAPVFLLVAFLAGRTLPAEHAFLFIGTLSMVSAAFGLGFVWSLPKH